jgi:hypothetical protein
MKKVLFSLLISTFLVFFVSFNTYSDSGSDHTSQISMQGKVIDKQTGESLAGVVIEVDGTDIKVYSDLEGNYTITGLKPGKYTIKINYISYKKDLKTIEIKDNESKNINILLEPVNS